MRATSLLSGMLLLVACGSGENGETEKAAEALPIGGMYEVTGVTVARESGHRREIAGTVILATEGDTYTATFNLNTTYPGADQALPAEVIGKGEGTIAGRNLLGRAETQLVMATVPGIDPGFAFVPRMVSTRVASSTTATVSADGFVSIEIESEAAPGSDYTPTRTTLHGSRISSAGLGGRDVASDRSPER
ncbi:MAG: hypothetical protein ACR2P8_01740 [Myxococcota bacterium]